MKSSVLAPFYQINPVVPSSNYNLVAQSKVPAVRMLHVEDLSTNPFPHKEVHSRLWTIGDYEEMRLARKGSAGAHEYFLMCLPRYNKLKSMGIYHVSGINEPHYWDLDTLKLYNQFHITLANLVGNIGMHFWSWDWGVGWPQYGHAKHWVESVRVARQTGGGLVVHLYGAPSVFRNENYPDKDYALRVYNQINELYDAGLSPGKDWVIIGECGIDGGVVQWDRPPWLGQKQRRGWKEWRDWVYSTPTGHQTMNEQLYWSQFSEYDDVLKGIPEVRWANPFIARPNNNWYDFEFTTYMLQSMVAKYDRIPMGEYLQQFVIPQYPNAALYRRAIEVNSGAIAVTPEKDHNGYRGQIFRFPGDDQWQHHFYCPIGKWGEITYERRRE